MASQPVKSTKPVRSQDTLPSSDDVAGNSLLRFHGSDAAPSSDPPPAPIAGPRKQLRPRSRLIPGFPGVPIPTALPIDRGRHGPPDLVSQSPAIFLRSAGQPSNAPPALADADTNRLLPLLPQPSTNASSTGHPTRTRLSPVELHPTLPGASRRIISSSHLSQPGDQILANAHGSTRVAPTTTHTARALPVVPQARIDASSVHTARSRQPLAKLPCRAKPTTPPILHGSMIQVNATAGPSRTTEAFDDGSTYANAVTMPLDPRKRQRQEDAFKNVQPATGDGPFHYYNESHGKDSPHQLRLTWRCWSLVRIETAAVNAVKVAISNAIQISFLE